MCLPLLVGFFSSLQTILFIFFPTDHSCVAFFLPLREDPLAFFRVGSVLMNSFSFCFSETFVCVFFLNLLFDSE